MPVCGSPTKRPMHHSHSLAVVLCCSCAGCPDRVYHCGRVVPSDSWAWWQAQRTKWLVLHSLNYSWVLSLMTVLIIVAIVSGLLQMMIWFITLMLAVSIAGVLETISWIVN